MLRLFPVPSDNRTLWRMAHKTLELPNSKRVIERAAAEDLLETIFLDLSRTDPHDTRELLRGIGAALHILSIAVPPTSSASREVWNQQQREGYRSRTAWKSWLLRQKFPLQGDRE